MLRLTGPLEPRETAEWLDDVLHWLRSPRGLPEQRPDESPAAAHLRTVVEAMAELPTQRERLQQSIGLLFARSSAVTLFTDVGVPSRQGFVSELADRMSRSLLPDPPTEGDLGELVARFFRSTGAADWFAALSPAQLGQLSSILGAPGKWEFGPLRRDLAEAAILLSQRICHHGLANDVRQRGTGGPLGESPFFRLPREVLEAVGFETTANDSPAASERCRTLIAECRKETLYVEATLERTGVSVDLVYRLDLVRRKLDRLEALLSILAPPAGVSTAEAGARLVFALVEGANRDRSVRDLWQASTRILARRVVEAAAHSGEHYATRTSRELHALVGSAGGGGAVTAFTATGKFLLSWVGLAPFWEGLAFALNYAGCFIVMQVAGFTLASKQPSMTAAHLARAIDEADTGSKLPFAHEVARVVRSQLAATLGNLGAAIPTAVAIDLALRLITGQGLLDGEYAGRVIAAHDPFATLVIPGAILTGVALWVSSVAAGTFENWATFRRLPEALAGQRWLRAVLGTERARKVSSALAASIGGLGGNLALGLQMGLVPSFAAFFGIPVQLPHVTVATGQLAFAGAARGPEGVLQGDFGWACLGILLIGAMNFGVSFALALWVALRARRTGALALGEVIRDVGKLFLARPMDFLRAPR